MMEPSVNVLASKMEDLNLTQPEDDQHFALNETKNTPKASNSKPKDLNLSIQRNNGQEFESIGDTVLDGVIGTPGCCDLTKFLPIIPQDMDVWALKRMEQRRMRPFINDLVTRI